MNSIDQDRTQDRTWMQRALELARRGIALCSPHPAVGCVILDRDGQLAGEGWHEYDRLDHAEVMAIKAAGQSALSADFQGNDAERLDAERLDAERVPAKSVAAESVLRDRLRGGTAYVTLEPCNHTGRTPPCTQALIEAGLARVVAATIDPNPSVAGHGLEALHAAGLRTSVGVCEKEARRLNEGFARWSQHRRPLVLMKVAMSLDGRIAPPLSGYGVPGDEDLSLGWTAGEPKQGAPYWITGEAARAAVQALRWQADAVITGIGTVLADDPLLTDRSGLGRRRPLLRVVLDSALRMPLDAKLVKTAADRTAPNDTAASKTGANRTAANETAANDLLIFTVCRDEARIRELAARGVRVEVLPAESGRVPLDKVLDKLGKEGISTLLTESGARLNTALMAGGFVDRVRFFVSPQIMGSGAAPAFGEMASAIHLPAVEVERYGGDLSLSSLIRDPWTRAPGR